MVDNSSGFPFSKGVNGDFRLPYVRHIISLRRKCCDTHRMDSYTYTISKDESGVILLCHGKGCEHIERVNEYDYNLGSQRTQAAQAMQRHAREKHSAPALKPVPHRYGVMEQW